MSHQLQQQMPHWSCAQVRCAANTIDTPLTKKKKKTHRSVFPEGDVGQAVGKNTQWRAHTWKNECMTSVYNLDAEIAFAQICRSQLA